MQSFVGGPTPGLSIADLARGLPKGARGEPRRLVKDLREMALVLVSDARPDLGDREICFSQ